MPTIYFDLLGRGTQHQYVMVNLPSNLLFCKVPLKDFQCFAESHSETLTVVNYW